MKITDAKSVEILIPADTLISRIKELGAEITKEYAETEQAPMLICVLKGSFVFMADLIRHIDLPITIDFLGTSSYGTDTKSSGVVKITKDLSESVKDRDLIIVEDIIDTGLTIDYLIHMLRTRGPNSIKICSLLHKPSRMKVNVPIDFLGFMIEDKFVIGYGLDYAQKYRNLDHIGVLSL
jgi:hypoxanthine phosphoribosyltransferase